MAEIPFETLIIAQKDKHSSMWVPTRVDIYKAAFSYIDHSIPNSRALTSNLAYSMQYLEFLEKEISELHLTSVLYVMIVKTYVITGMSVLEGLFSNIIKSHGWWKMTDLESIGSINANEKNFSGNKFVIRTELLQKTDPYPTQMNLDDLIKIMSKHHDALAVDHLVYPALKRLRHLRNRIHIQMNETETDHDYNAFDYKVKQEMGRILYEILTSSMVTKYPQYFEFLKVNVDN